MGDLIKSIYAGFMIGLGGTVYLSLENKIIGAILFSFGLLTIVNQGFYLYTGKVGYENSLSKLAIIILGNTIGTFIIAAMICLSKPELVNVANALWQNKYNLNSFQLIINSMLCGVMMYLAVDNYKRNKNILFIMMPVVIFIISGFEHSIANLFYMFLSKNVNIISISFIVICIAGNALGAKVFHSYKEIFCKTEVGE